MVHVEGSDMPILVFLVHVHREQEHFDVVVASYDLSCRVKRVSIHPSQGVVLQQVVFVLVVELDEYA